jgi:hypothetical protein
VAAARRARCSARERVIHGYARAFRISPRCHAAICQFCLDRFPCPMSGHLRRVYNGAVSHLCDAETCTSVRKNDTCLLHRRSTGYGSNSTNFCSRVVPSSGRVSIRCEAFPRLIRSGQQNELSYCGRILATRRRNASRSKGAQPSGWVDFTRFSH